VIGAVLDADPEAGGDGVVVVEVEQLAGDPRLPLRVDPEGRRSSRCSSALLKELMLLGAGQRGAPV
jgi:hypothetical protein